MHIGTAKRCDVIYVNAKVLTPAHRTLISGGWTNIGAGCQSMKTSLMVAKYNVENDVEVFF